MLQNVNNNGNVVKFSICPIESNSDLVRWVKKHLSLIGWITSPGPILLAFWNWHWIFLMQCVAWFNFWHDDFSPLVDFQLLKKKKDDGFGLSEKIFLNEANWQFHLIPDRVNEHHTHKKLKKKNKIIIQWHLNLVLILLGNKTFDWEHINITRQPHAQIRVEIVRKLSIRLKL